MLGVWGKRHYMEALFSLSLTPKNESIIPDQLETSGLTTLQLRNR